MCMPLFACGIAGIVARICTTGTLLVLEAVGPRRAEAEGPGRAVQAAGPVRAAEAAGAGRAAAAAAGQGLAVTQGQGRPVFRHSSGPTTQVEVSGPG